MTPSSQHDESAAELFARKLTAQLSLSEARLPYVVTERLRASRMQALAQRKRGAAPLHAWQPETALTPLVHSDGTLTLGSLGGAGQDRTPVWLRRLLTALPLVALLGGLAFISVDQDHASTLEVADLDAALLTSDLPPAAYTDPGFMQFLQTSGSTSSN